MDKYIIMGIDECGTEFRPDDKEYTSMFNAQANVGRARENYPEARSIWAELFQDATYFMRHQEKMEEYYDLDDNDYD